MYESDKSTVTNALQNSNAAVFTDATISKILALTTTANDTNVKIDQVDATLGGTIVTPTNSEVVMLNAPIIRDLPVTVQTDARVLALQGTTGFNVVIENTSPNWPEPIGDEPARIIIGSAGEDRIVINDMVNTEVTLGNGDVVVAGGGNDTINAGLGNSTVIGGSGNAVVKLRGDASDYVVVKTDQGVKVVGGGSTTDISKVQYVQLDDGKALVFAKDKTQAGVSTLFETTFGRTGTAAELKQWFDKAAAGMSLEAMAKEFAKTDAFKAITDAQNNADFVNGLYMRTFGRGAEADGLAYWKAALDTGGATREQLVYAFAEIGSQNLAGTAQHQETQVIGHVTIVTNII